MSDITLIPYRAKNNLFLSNWLIPLGLIIPALVLYLLYSFEGARAFGDPVFILFAGLGAVMLIAGIVIRILASSTKIHFLSDRQTAVVKTREETTEIPFSALGPFRIVYEMHMAGSGKDRRTERLYTLRNDSFKRWSVLYASADKEKTRKQAEKLISLTKRMLNDTTREES